MIIDELRRLQIFDILAPGEKFKREFLFDQLYESLPRDPQARVRVYHYEIAPGGWTNVHCHNGATFFICLQGEFEAHFEEGVLVRAKAGDVYSEPVGKLHRGHNPHPTIANVGIGFDLTNPDRDPMTMVNEELVKEGWFKQ